MSLAYTLTLLSSLPSTAVAYDLHADIVINFDNCHKSDLLSYIPLTRGQ